MAFAGNLAQYRDPGDKECRITIRFTHVSATVEQAGACGFGLNVSASGVYRKESNAAPKFDE